MIPIGETILVRNDAYWGDKPAFVRRELKMVPDELARANALRAGELDVIGGDWVAPLSPRRAKALQGEGMTIVAEPGTATTILGFSPKSPLMQDKAVRDAIFLGLDRATVATVLFEGFADPTVDIFPATVPTAGSPTPVPARDVAAAQAALTAGGWTGDGAGWTKDGMPLEIAFLVSEESFPGSRRIAEMIQGMLMEVGVKANIETVDNATMHDRRPSDVRGPLHRAERHPPDPTGGHDHFSADRYAAKAPGPCAAAIPAGLNVRAKTSASVAIRDTTRFPAFRPALTRRTLCPSFLLSYPPRGVIACLCQNCTNMQVTPPSSPG